MTYLKKILIGFDQFVNTICNGYPDETLSARCYRLAEKGNTLPQKIVNALLFWDKNHCYKSYLSEVRRKQYPEEYRNLK